MWRLQTKHNCLLVISRVAISIQSTFVNLTQMMYMSPEAVSFGRVTLNKLSVNSESGLQVIPARTTPYVRTGTIELDIGCSDVTS